MSIQHPAPQSVTVLGSHTKYWVYNEGAAQTILMVHGFRGNHLGLQYIISHLGRYRIVVPDLPGFGQSEPMTDHAHDIAGYADFVREFVAAAGLHRPVLLGHSFGSIVAADVAAHSPEVFSKLILVNPIAVSPRTGTRAPATKLVEAYYWVAAKSPDALSAKVLGSRTFARLMSLSLSRTKDPQLRRLVYDHHLADLKQPQRRKVIAEAFAASITRTALDDAPRITLETLLVAGQKDPIAPPRTQAKLHSAIPGSRLVLIPKVGHLIHLETPGSAADAISAFLG